MIGFSACAVYAGYAACAAYETLFFVYTRKNTFGPSEIINYPDRALSSAAQFDDFFLSAGHAQHED